LLSPSLFPLLAKGDGVGGSADSVDSLREELREELNEDDPKLCRRPLSRFPLANAFWKRGLVGVGEYDALRGVGLPVPGTGDVLRLDGLPARDPEANRYLGGVRYCVPGVTGGVELGSRPRSARCVGVKGISDRSSFGRKRG
jgi:hypothetical protein